METKEGRVYRVDKDGKMDRMCHRGNRDSKECLLCDDCLARPTELGKPLEIICRGSVVDKYHKGG